MNDLINKYVALEDEIKRRLNRLPAMEHGGACMCKKSKTFIGLIEYQDGDLCVVKRCLKCGGYIV
jgi:hypothetical protein